MTSYSGSFWFSLNGGIGGDLSERAAAADRAREGVGGEVRALGGGDEVLGGGGVRTGEGVELGCTKEQVLSDMSRRTGEGGQLGGGWFEASQSPGLVASWPSSLVAQ